MKRLMLGCLAAFFLFSTALQAQIFDPVTWSTSIEQAEDGGVVLVATASIDDGWHMYSQHVGDYGPIPTTFYDEKSDDFEEMPSGHPLFQVYNSALINGMLWSEDEPVVEYDKNFKMDLAYFTKSATFKRLIKRVNFEAFTYDMEVEFMVCDSEKCLPPAYMPLHFSIPKGNQSLATSPADISLEGEASGLVEDAKTGIIASASKSTLFALFGEGMFWGFLALLMPCIFPMIPLTVSFFMKQSKNRSQGIRRAVVYGISINVIYVAIGILITAMFGSSALNALATNPWFNLFFFALFVVFAISFFGAFELTLPSSWVNKSDDASQKGGLFGIFFMAFTLSLVSFSCTGPLIGTALVSAATSGELLGPAVTMFGFSFALSLPFMLFAAFPGWLNGLPKSGGWLNTVKVVLGFLELAFALKFLSTADMVWQNHWLERELFIAIWTGIAFITAYYLFGGFRMPHDSEVKTLSVPRMLFATTFTLIGFYLLPGTFGAPVKLISGFPPPDFYAESPPRTGISSSSVDVLDPSAHCPLNLPCFNDLDKAMAYAESVNKPILFDFTGWGCVNCRKMEEEVWSDPEVRRFLAEEVVLVSLYVDERTKLDEPMIGEFSGKPLKYSGQIWSEFQAKNYQANAQPFYVMIDASKGYEALHESASYDPDVDKYMDWLKRGLAAYKAP
ncbi:MAG: cytochrome c biogenesis protein CcdA [Schleiferiaceae bacterium]|nr:cytochrome c biogenesis protein CcdA [Schleiferiaceae bacterium]